MWPARRASRYVRKLKELGLTESLEVGYRLSPRGQVVLDAARRRQALPGVARHCPASLGTARRRQALPGVARHCPASPGTARRR
jgi:hypothetical protein